MKELNKKLDNENGSALVIVMMVLVVVSALGGALGMVTINSHNLAEHTQDSNSAYYIAEAGANMAYEEFKLEVLNAYGVSSTENDFFTADSGVKKAQASVNGKVYSEEVFQKTGGIQPTANIEVGNPVGIGDQRTFTIKSTGTIDGKTRVVEKEVKVTWVGKGNGPKIEMPTVDKDTAIIYKSKITFQNNSHVTGDIYNDGGGVDDGYSKTTHNGVKRNGIIKDNNIDWNRYIDLVNSFPAQPHYNRTLTYNSEDTLVIEENTYIQEMNLSKNLTIDTKGRTVSLIVDELNIGANINILGQGKVNLYVTSNLSFSSNNLNINHTGNTNQINILYAGIPEVSLSNNSSFNGTIFLQKANMVFNQNTTIKGTIISGGNQIILNQNAAPNALIIAPNSNTIFNQNSILNGTIVANNITLNQNATVNRSYRTIDEFPFQDSDAPGVGTGEGLDMSNLISSTPATEN